MHNKFEIYDPINNEFEELSPEKSGEGFGYSLKQSTHVFGNLEISIQESKFGVHRIYPVLNKSCLNTNFSQNDLERCEKFLSKKKLVLSGSEFHRKILRSLIHLKIKPNSTKLPVLSYSDFTVYSGLTKNYVRAVARSIASNEHFLTIPCHRIIAHDGSMRGYRWGTPLKKLLINCSL